MKKRVNAFLVGLLVAASLFVALHEPRVADVICFEDGSGRVTISWSNPLK